MLCSKLHLQSQTAGMKSLFKPITVKVQECLVWKRFIPFLLVEVLMWRPFPSLGWSLRPISRLSLHPPPPLTWRGLHHGRLWMSAIILFVTVWFRAATQLTAPYTATW